MIIQKKIGPNLTFFLIFAFMPICFGLPIFYSLIGAFKFLFYCIVLPMKYTFQYDSMPDDSFDNYLKNIKKIEE